MFHPDHDFGASSGDDLLAELGIDPNTVREVIEDDRAIRCPHRGAVYPDYGFASLYPEPTPDRGPGQAMDHGLHEAGPDEPWDPASSLPPED